MDIKDIKVGDEAEVTFSGRVEAIDKFTGMVCLAHGPWYTVDKVKVVKPRYFPGQVWEDKGFRWFIYEYDGKLTARCETGNDPTSTWYSIQRFEETHPDAVLVFGKVGH
jgi:hypothetical protein